MTRKKLTCLIQAYASSVSWYSTHQQQRNIFCPKYFPSPVVRVCKCGTTGTQRAGCTSLHTHRDDTNRAFHGATFWMYSLETTLSLVLPIPPKNVVTVWCVVFSMVSATFWKDSNSGIPSRGIQWPLVTTVIFNKITLACMLKCIC